MRERKGEHPYGDAGQLILLVSFIMVWVADSFYLHASTFLAVYIPLALRLALLVLMLLAAFYLSWSGHVVLRDRQRPSRVISTGAFHYVRHPLYLANLLVYLGMSISTASLLSLALLAMIFAFYNYIAGYEEKIMEEKFGDEYRRYKATSGKWLPKMSAKK